MRLAHAHHLSLQTSNFCAVGGLATIANLYITHMLQIHFAIAIYIINITPS